MSASQSANMSFAKHVLKFNKNLRLDDTLPEGVDVLYPYHNPVAVKLSTIFYNKYYNDNNRRTLIMGINPGRLGGGVTGVPFTDPIKLETFCNIPNTLTKKAELSADFIYKMITAYGGPELFYHNFYITSISPLGFTKDGKNLNYYDIRELQEDIHQFILACINKQLTFGINREVCYCLGEGQNFKFLSKLNGRHKFFNTIIPLPHPRFIMQYKRKKVPDYIDLYLRRLNS